MVISNSAQEFIKKAVLNHWSPISSPTIITRLNFFEDTCTTHWHRIPWSEHNNVYVLKQRKSSEQVEMASLSPPFYLRKRNPWFWKILSNWTSGLRAKSKNIVRGCVNRRVNSHWFTWWLWLGHRFLLLLVCLNSTVLGSLALLEVYKTTRVFFGLEI